MVINVIKKIKHPYLILSFLLSMLTVIMQSTYVFLSKDFEGFLLGLFFLIVKPFVIIIFICLICIFLSKKYPKGTKVFSGILNSLILIFQMVFMSCGLTAFHYISTHEDCIGYNYNNISDYDIAKKKISCSKCIKHFPKEIPASAKNIHFYMYTNNWFGSEGIFLVFDADKNYIEQEIKQYKYKYIVQPHTDDYNPAFKNKRNSMKINYHDGFNMNESDFKFYAIGSDVSFGNSGRAYEYGIGVNEKQNTIIYYYDESD